MQKAQALDHIQKLKDEQKASPKKNPEKTPMQITSEELCIPEANLSKWGQKKAKIMAQSGQMEAAMSLGVKRRNMIKKVRNLFKKQSPQVAALQQRLATEMQKRLKARRPISLKWLKTIATIQLKEEYCSTAIDRLQGSAKINDVICKAHSCVSSKNNDSQIILLSKLKE